MPDWFTKRNAGRGAAWLTIATVLAAGFEGYAAYPYIDRIGTGHPITYCYGETRADGPIPQVPKGGFSEAYCRGELAKKLETVYGPAVEKCIPGMPPHRKAAIVDLAYNAGPGSVCNGQIARLLNAGDVAGGCRALLGYIYASHRVVKGLQRRRQSEYVMCLRND